MVTTRPHFGGNRLICSRPRLTVMPPAAATAREAARTKARRATAAILQGRVEVYVLR